MSLNEARAVLEAIGIADTVTDEIIEASTVVLDALELASVTEIKMVEPPNSNGTFQDMYLRRQGRVPAWSLDPNPLRVTAIPPLEPMVNDTTEIPMDELAEDYYEQD